MSFPALILLAFTALCAGWVDAIAGGGGLLTLPALFIAGLPPHVALGTNKLQAICGTTAAAIRYCRGGAYDRSLILLFLPVAIIGSLAGSRAVLFLSPELLRPLIIPVLLLIGWYVYVRREVGIVARPELSTSSRRATAAGLVFVIAFYDGFFGPGTGVFLFLVGIGITGLSSVTATGTAKVVNVATNLMALTMFLAHDRVHLGIGLMMAVANAIGGVVGSSSAIRRGQPFIRRVVLVVVVALALRLAYDGM